MHELNPALLADVLMAKVRIKRKTKPQDGSYSSVPVIVEHEQYDTDFPMPNIMPPMMGMTPPALPPQMFMGGYNG